MEELAPGVRFYPTEEELVSFYLHHKLDGKREDLNRVMDRIIPVLDIYEFSPWQLPQFSGQYNHKDPEQWFFFIPRQESEARGGRPKRLTSEGFWKATGSPGLIYSSNNRCIAVKRTMVFYNGRAPNGRKTDWKMNEYKAIQLQPQASTAANPTLRLEFSVARVYKKSKCLRSFDRRPIGVEYHRGQVRAQFQAQDDEGLLRDETDPQNPEMVETSRRSSADDDSSISSGDQIGEGSNNMPMDHTGNDESLWDLEELSNWDFDMQDI